jgi:hypothetical protein
MPRPPLYLDLGPAVLELGEGWAEVIDEEDDDAPFTLTRQSDDACGAFQLTFATYQGGEVPDSSPEDLARMVRTFGEKAGLGEAEEQVTEAAPLRLAAASFWDDESFVRVWFVSDGASFAQITYTVAVDADFDAELLDCERMVRTIAFSAGSEQVS